MSHPELTDAFLAAQLGAFEKKRLASFDEAALPVHLFSKNFEDKMAGLIRQGNRRYITVLGLRVRRLVAVCALLGLILSGCAAARLIGNILVERHREYSRLTFPNITEEMRQQEFVFVTPPVPEGFTVVESTQLHAMQIIDYEDGNGAYINFFQGDIRGLASHVDTEGVKTRRIEINGHEGITHTKNGYHYIMWVDGINSFSFSGECDFEFLKSVAESLK